jgi:hypothetical protein
MFAGQVVMIYSLPPEFVMNSRNLSFGKRKSGNKPGD